MPDMSITAEGIGKLLVGLNPHMAAEPNKIKTIVLQTLYKNSAHPAAYFPVKRYPARRCL